MHVDEGPDALSQISEADLVELARLLDDEGAADEEQASDGENDAQSASAPPAASGSADASEVIDLEPGASDGDPTPVEPVVVSPAPGEPQQQPDVGEDPPAPAAPPATPLIVGPGAMGYYRNTTLDRTIGRVSGPFRNNYGVRCFLHGKCSLLVGAHRMPAEDELRQWFANVVIPETDCSRERSAALYESHLAQLRALLPPLPGAGRQ